MEDLKQINDLQIFLKSALCIDGECKFLELVKVESSFNVKESMLFLLTDSKRGLFYITLSV